jgi:hypothetical protein
MKKMLWQLPAVISATAVSTFCGVTVLQAAVNGPLQERGAIVLAERAIASERAQAAAKPRPVAGTGAARATPTAAVRPAASPTTVACGEAACGDPASDVPRGAQAPRASESAAGARRPAQPAAARQHGSPGDKGRPDAGPAATEPGKGVGAGRKTAPGQSRDADGRPAKARGGLLDDLGRSLGKAVGAGRSSDNGAGAGRSAAPGQNRDAAGRPTQAKGTPKWGPGQSQGNGREQNPGNGQDRGKGQGAEDRFGPSRLGPAGEAAREAARWLDRLLGLPEPPGLSGAAGKGSGPRR